MNSSTKRKLLTVFMLSGAVIAFASPLNTLVDAAIAANRSTAHFIPYSLEARIQHESGAENLAILAAPELDNAIALIEHHQAHPFQQPVTVYAIATWQSFQRLTPAKGKPRAVVFNQKVFLSPKLAARPESIAATLVHELSHLHISQLIGSWRFYTLPTWFKEGLATYLSEGMGAENVSEKEAITAIKTGQRFTPTSDTNSLFPKSADSYNLTVHMFYRQSALFIGYLDDQQPNAIGSCIAQLKTGKSFSDAFETAFGKTVEEEWAQFLEAVGSSKGQ